MKGDTRTLDYSSYRSSCSQVENPCRSGSSFCIRGDGAYWGVAAGNISTYNTIQALPPADIVDG